MFDWNSNSGGGITSYAPGVVAAQIKVACPGHYRLSDCLDAHA